MVSCSLYDSEEVIPMDLFTAAGTGHLEVVKDLLIRKASNVNVSNEGGWTALMYASYIGHNDIVHALLDEGADATVRNSAGRTPLMLAAACGNDSTAKLLIEKMGKPNVDTADNKGWTALFHATCPCHTSMVRFLLKSGANPNVRDKQSQWTPLMLAASEGHELLVECLLNANTDLDAAGIHGETARSLAADKNRAKILGLIESFVRKKTDAESLMDFSSDRLSGAAESHSAFAQQQVDAYFSRVRSQAMMGLNRASIPQDPKPTTLVEFLSQLALKDYLPVFQEQDIDLATLLQLNDSDLKEIGIKKLGPRRKLTNAISRWHSDYPVINGDPMEQALANFHRAAREELERTVEKISKENNNLMGEIENEKCLREVIESSFADLKTMVHGVVDTLRPCLAKMDTLREGIASSSDSNTTEALSAELQHCQQLVQSVLQSCSNKVVAK